MSIIREDPPPATGGRGPNLVHAETAKKLKTDPGNWYKISEGNKWPQTAVRINLGEIAAFRPAHTFQATARRVDDGTYTIYARYVGEAS